MAELFVHELPGNVEPQELAGSSVIVIDMLRASTTICFALAAGAKCVVPLLEIDEALQLGEQLGREYVVLGGERSGKIIEGFDVGNSPREYSPQRVSGKMVLFTTTNGTRALAHAVEAAHVFVGAAVNRGDIAHAVRFAKRVDLLCSGTDGEVTGDDMLAAGSIVERLVRDAPTRHWRLNDPAIAAHQRWRMLIEQASVSNRSIIDELTVALRETTGGKNLFEAGHQGDIADCARLDALSVVPELNRTTRQITLR